MYELSIDSPTCVPIKYPFAESRYCLLLEVIVKLLIVKVLKETSELDLINPPQLLSDKSIFIVLLLPKNTTSLPFIISDCCLFNDISSSNNTEVFILISA